MVWDVGVASGFECTVHPQPYTLFFVGEVNLPYQLDESTERRQLKSPRSLSGRSINLTWSQNGHSHGHEWPTATPFVQCQSTLPFWDTDISKFDHENPWSMSSVWSKVNFTFELQNSKVMVMVKVKPIGQIWGLEFNSYVCFLFLGNRTTFGWDIRNSIFDLEKKVKVMAKVKPDGHIRGLGVQSICLLSVSWQSDHVWLRYSKFHIWPWKI